MGQPPAGYLRVPAGQTPPHPQRLLPKVSSSRKPSGVHALPQSDSHPALHSCPHPAPWACVWFSPALPSVLCESVFPAGPEALQPGRVYTSTQSAGPGSQGVSRPCRQVLELFPRRAGLWVPGASPSRPRGARRGGACRSGSGRGPGYFWLPRETSQERRGRRTGKGPWQQEYKPIRAAWSGGWQAAPPAWGPRSFKWCIFTACYSGANTRFLHQVLGAHEAGGLDITDNIQEK